MKKGSREEKETSKSRDRLERKVNNNSKLKKTRMGILVVLD
jgi:hypothetical protein